jgi:adenylosuccinate synthase
VLLDEWRGFHPFTTWSCCTDANALELISEAGQDARVTRIGVLRSYAVRHGAGPLPTETQALRPGTTEHNAFNDWQGPVRYGWFDAVLARYALEVVGGVDSLALTHLDAPRAPHPWAVCSGYQGAWGAADAELAAHTSAAGILTRLAVGPSRSLEHQSRLAQLLTHATPLLEACEPNERAALSQIERLLDRGIDITSRGPCATDVTMRSARTEGIHA